MKSELNKVANPKLSIKKTAVTDKGKIPAISKSKTVKSSQWNKKHIRYPRKNYIYIQERKIQYYKVIDSPKLIPIHYIPNQNPADFMDFHKCHPIPHSHRESPPGLENCQVLTKV